MNYCSYVWIQTQDFSTINNCVSGLCVLIIGIIIFLTSAVYLAESSRVALGSVTSSCSSSPMTRTLWSFWVAPTTWSTFTGSKRTKTSAQRSPSAASPLLTATYTSTRTSHTGMKIKHCEAWYRWSVKDIIMFNFSFEKMLNCFGCFLC